MSRIIPTKTEEVTPDWLSEILGIQISPDNFLLTPNAQAGSGFLSNLVRVSCHAVDKETKKLQLVVKLLPGEGVMKDLVISQKFDQTEINFYRSVIPDLTNQLPELKNFFCPFYAGCIQEANSEENLHYSSALILEDLKPLGYYTIDFAGEETLEQIQVTVEFMAKLHFAGEAIVDRKKTTIDKLYPFLQNLNEEGASFFYDMAKDGFKAFDAVLAERGGNEATRRAYQELEPHSQSIIEIVRSKTKEFACMIHGDLWSNNLLFQGGPHSNTIKVIDWQLAGYNDPTIDLAVLLVSSLPVDKLTPENIEKFLNHYFDEFARHAEEAKLPHLVRRDRQTFSQYFYTYAMSYTFLWFAMAVDPFAKNFSRLVRIFEFLDQDMKVPQFLLEEIKQRRVMV